MVKLDTVMDFGLGPFISQVLAVTLIIFIIYLLYRIFERFNLLVVIPLTSIASFSSCISEENMDGVVPEGITVEKLIEKYDLQQIEEKNNTREEPRTSLRFETAEEADIF